MEKFELDWLKKWARYCPQANAIKDSDTGVCYSYETLYFLSCRLAAQLVCRFEIQPGQRIAVLATNEIEFLPLFFAVQRLGAILVPLNFRLTAREVAHILSDCAPQLLIHQEQFTDLLLETEPRAVPYQTWLFDGDSGLCSFCETERRSFHRDRSEQNWPRDFVGEVESPCMLIYTSGTTGSPKGAIITNKCLHWNSINTQLRLDVTRHDTTVAFAPFFHTGGWNVLLTPFLHHGASTVLLRKFDARRILELIEKERITKIFGVPTMLDMMARDPLFETVDLKSLRFAVVGGEPMPLELINIWESKGVPIRQGYGLTEFGPNVFSLNEEDSRRKSGSIGFANFYIETRVVDDNGKEVGAGEIGELLLKGPVCTPGYWNNPKATAEAIEGDWFHTGDLVRFDDEGYFYVAGRKKDMYKSGGENVYPVEVERFLSTHPAIRETAVVGVPDIKWGEVGMAFIAVQNGMSLTTEEVSKFCESGLARFKIPRFIEFMPELPKSDSGKILKRKLRELPQVKMLI
jgi:fatty-acyl-CoA synthase